MVIDALTGSTMVGLVTLLVGCSVVHAPDAQTAESRRVPNIVDIPAFEEGMFAADNSHFRGGGYPAWDVHVDSLGLDHTVVTPTEAEMLVIAAGGDHTPHKVLLYQDRSARNDPGFQRRPIMYSAELLLFTSVMLMDVDRDGRREVLAGAVFGTEDFPFDNRRGAGIIAWDPDAEPQSGLGSGTRGKQLLEDVSVTAIDYMDVNADGSLDLVVGMDAQRYSPGRRRGAAAPSAQVAIYANRCGLRAWPAPSRILRCFDFQSPTHAWTVSEARETPAGNAPLWVQAVDADLDHRTDIVVSVPHRGTVVIRRDSEGMWPPDGSIVADLTACDTTGQERICRWGDSEDVDYSMDIVRSGNSMWAARSHGCIVGHGRSCEETEFAQILVQQYPGTSFVSYECPGDLTATAVHFTDSPADMTQASVLHGCQRTLSPTTHPIRVSGPNVAGDVAADEYWVRDIDAFATGWEPPSLVVGPTDAHAELPARADSITLPGAGPYQVHQVTLDGDVIERCTADATRSQKPCWNISSGRRAVFIANAPNGGQLTVTAASPTSSGWAVADATLATYVELLWPSLTGLSLKAPPNTLNNTGATDVDTSSR